MKQLTTYEQQEAVRVLVDIAKVRVEDIVSRLVKQHGVEILEQDWVQGYIEYEVTQYITRVTKEFMNN